MKTDTKNLKVFTNTETFSYTFEANAELFKLLIDDLYSDKIGAVLRELGANAVDSHIQAGHKKNFDIHLPKITEPWFAIRDYGIGLNAEEIRNLYTCLGASSKRNTNDLIGCIGIGSKSPFAYSRTTPFSITSYKNRVKYSYSAFIDQEGMPKLAVFEEEKKTLEPNGLEVKFNVYTKDFYEFEHKAKHIYEFFPIKPNIETNKTEYIYKNKDYGLKKSGKNLVIMGGIKYNVDCTYIPYPFILDLYFDIGELEVTGNREGLQYTEKTKLALVEKVKNVKEELSNFFSKDLENCTSLYQAFFKGQLYSKYNIDLKYKNEKIPRILEKKLCNNYRIFYRLYRSSLSSKKVYQYLLIEKPTIFVYNDLKRGAISRCQELYENKGVQVALLYDKTDLDSVIQDWGIDFINASSLPKPIITRSTISRKQKKESFLIYEDVKNNIYLYEYWREIDKIPPKTYYVIVNNHKPILDGNRIDPRYIHHIKKLMKIDNVYGVSKEQSVNLHKSNIELFNDFKTNYKITTDFKKYLYYNHNFQLDRLKIFNISTITQFVNKVKNIDFDKLKTEAQSLVFLNQLFQLESPKCQLNLEEEYNKLRDKYRLLFEIGNINTKSLEHLNIYLQAIGE